MPDVQEVFRMATQKVRPDAGFPERQLDHQRRRTRNRKLGALALAAVIALIGTVVVIRAMGEPQGQPAGQPTGGIAPVASPIPSLPLGSVEPGRYVFAASDPALDTTHEITIEVPRGYTSVGESAVLKAGTGQTSVSTLVITDVYVDPCHWQGGTTLDRSAISSVDDLVAALSTQQGLRVSAPAAGTLDGLAGTYLERRVPNGMDVSGCDLGEFHLYGSGWGDRWLTGGGQLQRLWIVDVEGVPLVIDATVEPDTSRKVRADLEQMVESIQIDPR